MCIRDRFKITPDYVEIERDIDNGYTVGVYLSIGLSIHHQNISNAIPIETFGSFPAVQKHILENESNSKREKCNYSKQSN